MRKPIERTKPAKVANTMIGSLRGYVGSCGATARDTIRASAGAALPLSRATASWYLVESDSTWSRNRRTVRS